MSFILTLFAPLLAILGGGYCCKKKENADDLFKKDYTTVLKGICCIIVVMVHIPLAYQNPLQDLIGSFGYICVTLFFMVSAYGIQYSAERKPDYLKHFWRNRIVALLTPCIVINICTYFVNLILKNENIPSVFWAINSYVLVLLQYCLWFYVVIICCKKFGLEKKGIVDLFLIMGVIASSFYLYFFSEKGVVSARTGWCYERYGLIWGILFYRLLPKIKIWLQEKRIVKTVLFFVLSLFLGVVYLKYKHVFFWGEYFLKILLGVSIIMFMLLMTVRRQYGNRLSLYLGDISYEVYLSHGLIMGYIAYLLPNISSGVFILMTYLCTVLFSIIIHSVAKKIVVLLRV